MSDNADTTAPEVASDTGQGAAPPASTQDDAGEAAGRDVEGLVKALTAERARRQAAEAGHQTVASELDALRAQHAEATSKLETFQAQEAKRIEAIAEANAARIATLPDADKAVVDALPELAPEALAAVLDKIAARAPEPVKPPKGAPSHTGGGGGADELSDAERAWLERNRSDMLTSSVRVQRAFLKKFGPPDLKQ